VWLAPQPWISIAGFEGGSVDFFDLFEPDAAWSTTAERTHVFKMYDELGLGRPATDDEWRAVIEGVSARGMALAMELGPLPETEGCGGGEGFGMAHSLALVRKVQSLGGRVDLVVFDAPYAFGHFYDGTSPVACHWSAERIAREAADFVRELREIEPEVVVGGIEALWRGMSADDLVQWLDAYEEAAGEPLAFLHLDIDWNRRDWPEVALQIEQEARSRGVAFGLIYNGGQAGSDEAWIRAALERMYTYEEVWGGRPDHVIVQSWHPYPSRALPDTSRATLTGLLNGYLGERTSIAIASVASPRPGRLSIEGSVASTSGEGGVANVPLKLDLTPIDGAAQELTLGGRVPTGATSAVVGIRVNVEAAGPGAADMSLYEVTYADGARTGDRVPDPGVMDWGADGDGSATIEPSDRGPGSALRLIASPEQWISINSPEVEVAAGTDYRLSVTAAIPEASADAGYISVIFLRQGAEIARHSLPLAPVPIPLGPVSTDGSGAFELEEDGLEGGRYGLRISYGGDVRHWPSRADQELVIR
jgi:hypothetical protein